MNPDKGKIKLRTSIRIDKFDGEPKEGDQPVESIIIDQEGNKTIINGKEESVGSKQ